jgi:tRNA-dihydrouridine synthase A
MDVDQRYYEAEAGETDKKALVRGMYPYIEAQLIEGATLHHITRHMLGLFNGQPGARLFRRHLSEQAPRRGSGLDVLEQALELVREAEPQSAAE